VKNTLLTEVINSIIIIIIIIIIKFTFIHALTQQLESQLKKQHKHILMENSNYIQYWYVGLTKENI
jgi:hypothetical protein